jgi:hypothetical protein
MTAFIVGFLAGLAAGNLTAIVVLRLVMLRLVATPARHDVTPTDYDRAGRPLRARDLDRYDWVEQG